MSEISRRAALDPCCCWSSYFDVKFRRLSWSDRSWSSRVPYAPGGESADITILAVVGGDGKAARQTLVIDARGGGGMIGAKAVSGT